jgi:hypothetical protein
MRQKANKKRKEEEMGIPDDAENLTSPICDQNLLISLD